MSGAVQWTDAQIEWSSKFMSKFLFFSNVLIKLETSSCSVFAHLVNVVCISKGVYCFRFTCHYQSFLQDAEVCSRLKATLSILESCMKCLESLDTVRLPYDSEPERKERKYLVDHIQV